MKLAIEGKRTAKEEPIVKKGRERRLKGTPPAELTVSDYELDKMIRWIRKESRSPIRDEAVIVMVYEHGLFTREMKGMSWRAIDLKEEVMRLDCKKLWTQKAMVNSPYRYHRLSRRMTGLLKRLKERRPRSSYVFTFMRRNIMLGEMGFQEIPIRAALRCGLGKFVNMTTIRRSCIKNLVNKGMPLSNIACYLHSNTEAVRRAVDRMNAHAPFNGESKENLL